MRTISILVVAVVLVVVTICGSALATTMSKETVPDPVGEGECEITVIGSYGSYIYDYDTKYDAVYWPHTTGEWLCTCEGSGYTSWADDFNELTAEEISRIRNFLAQEPAGPEVEATFNDRLDRAERIYRLRDKKASFWAFFYRVRAIHAPDEDLAAEYRAKALEILEENLDEMPDGFDKIQALFLIGEYKRRVGEIAAALEAFGAAGRVEWVDDEGNANVGHRYFNRLIEDRATLFTCTVPQESTLVEGIGLGASVDQVRKALGEPSEIDELGGSETAFVHKYPGAEVFVVDGLVKGLSFKRLDWTTTGGLRVGDPREYVQAVLGPGHLGERRRRTYLRYGIGGEEQYLMFRIEEDKVREILLVLAYR